MRPSRQSLLVLLAVVLLVLLRHGWSPIEVPPTGKPVAGDGIEHVIASRANGAWVEIAGNVVRLLPDDREGVEHQRFILRLKSGRTVLVAHNIDLAQRVPVQVGDAVRLRGRYEWNDKGGVIHWTHHDPGNRQSGGWIERKGIRYQ